jgi:triosephosphate isomerase
MGASEIDGALVGGASLKVADFTTIVTGTAQIKQ